MRRVTRDERTRRVALIGTGVTGSSLGLALRCFTSDYEVIAFDHDDEVLQLALELGVCDDIASSAADAAQSSDIVVLAVPLDVLEPVMAEVSTAVVDGTWAVTDISSVKRLPGTLGQRYFGSRFVGGHVITASDTSGVTGAHADLLAGAPWVLTPSEGTSHTAVMEVKTLVRAIGARPIITEAEPHDAMVARCSQLPYLVNAAILRSVVRTHGRDARTGFNQSLRDETTADATDPAVSLSVLSTNADEIQASLEELIVDLRCLHDLIACGDSQDLAAWLDVPRLSAKSSVCAAGQQPSPGRSGKRQSSPSQPAAPYPVDDEGAACDGAARGRRLDSPVSIFERAATKRIEMSRTRSPLGPL